MNKRKQLTWTWARRVYRVIDKGAYDSETIEHYKKLNIVILAPWNSNKYIKYIGKGNPQWPKLLHLLKVRAARLETINANCVTRCYADTATLSKVDQGEILKINLKEVKRIAKHLEHLSGLPITRNAIMVAGKKNERFCRGGMSGYHIAHYHCAKPHRICFRPMFLLNPDLPTREKCSNCNKRHIRYILTCDRPWFKLSPTPEIRMPVTPILALIDCTCHELAHHGTKGHDDPEFQKKYLLLFSTILNDIISGKYYIERIN